jgi:hypothetical protein
MNVNIIFEPNRRQAEVLAEFYFAPGVEDALLMGGVRSGKTTLGHVLTHLEATRYDFPTTGIVVRATHDEAITINAGLFLKQFKREDREYMIENFNKKEGILTYPNGSQVFFWGLGKEGESRDIFEKIESLEFDWAFIDDARRVPRNVYEYIKTRMSGKGSRKILLSTNPPPRTHWLYGVFGQEKLPPYLRLYKFRLLDNQQNLPPEYVKRMEHMPPSYRLVYVEGEWGETYTEGGVFEEEFSFDAHVREEFGFKPDLLPRQFMAGLDFRGVWACGLGQENPNRTVDVFYENILTGAHVLEWFEQLRDDIHKKFSLGVRNIKWYGDIAGNQTESINDSAIGLIRKKFGINIITKKFSVSDSVMTIKAMLTENVKDQDGRMRPKFGIHPSCETLIAAFMGAYRTDDRGNIVKTRPYIDILDATRYMLNHYVLSRSAAQKDMGWAMQQSAGGMPGYTR